MLKFEWNALRLGHRVRVHDPASSTMELLPGTVAMVETHRGRGSFNGVGVRVHEADGAAEILWPSYLSVHGDALDEAEPCWRCDEMVALPARRVCGRCRGIFPGDPTLARGVDLGWWACPPCHGVLFGG